MLAISSGAPAFSVCDNIAYYVIIFAGTAFFGTWYPTRTHMLRVPVMRPLMFGTIIPFMPVLFATLFGF